MPDPEKSGAPESGSADLSAPPPAGAPPSAENQAAADAPSPPATAPAHAPAPEPTPAPAEVAPKVGAFGSTRGSGLARGKRPMQLAPSTTAKPAAAGVYKPTALEVITPQSGYKNPFTGETSVSSPAVNEPALQAAPPPPVGEPAAPAPMPTPAPESAAATAAGSQSSAEPTADKAELNIIPPEQPKRPTVHWEATGTAREADPAHARREERPPFQPRDRREGDRRDPREMREPRERREGRGFDPRDRREGDRREGDRREPRSFEPRSPQPPAQPAAPAKSGGFVGWLKGLFGGSKTEAPAPAPQARREEGGHYRQRGGRDGDRERSGGGGYRGERGPREGGSGQPGQSGGYPRDDFRGEGGEGQRRRRRRGGRGRNRGDGGGDRGPRPEGQQGGGAI